MQRGISFFLIGVMALGALAFALWPADGDAPIAIAPPSGTPSPSPTAHEGPPTASPIQLPSDALHVHVAVVAHERFVPPPIARASALDLADGKTLHAWPIAGVGAGFDAPEQALGIAMLAIERGSTTVLRQVALAERELAEVRLGGLVEVAGMVRDAEGRPVPGASVWFGERLADGSWREVTTVETVDPEDASREPGRFRAAVPAGDGVPLVVRKPGFATWWRPLQIASPMAPIDVVLQPACTLDVQLAGTATDLAQARLFVVPEAPIATELTTWPFFLQALTDGVAFDARGVASLGELPRAGTLRLVVRHPLAAMQRAITVVMKGERVRAVVPTTFDAATWSGRVVDADGAPLPGVELWTRLAATPLYAGAGQRLLPPHLDGAGLRIGRSGGDGAFALGAVAGGVLSLRAHGRAGRDVPEASLTAGADLVLPTWVGGEPEFTLQPPQRGQAWQVACDLGGGLQAAVAADQVFRVSLPYAGRFDFVLTTKRGEQVVGSRTDRSVMVTGPIELAAPAPQ